MALTDQLITSLRFDESSGNATDSSGNSKTFTNNNTVPYVTGKVNNGADLESGSSHSFSRSNGTYYDITSGTINVWIKPEAIANELMILHTTTNLGAGGFYLGARLTSPTNGVRFGFGDGTNQVVSTNNVISNGTFAMVTVTWNTSRKEIFINGSSVAANETDETMTAGTSTIYLGSNSGGADYFDGIIDELNIWSRVLSGAEITQLYNSGNGMTVYTPLTASVGTFTLTGNATAFIISMVARVRTFVLTGNPITLTLKKWVNTVKNSTSWLNQDKS